MAMTHKYLHRFIILLALAILQSSGELKISISPDVIEETMEIGQNYTITCLEPGVDPATISMSHGDSVYLNEIHLININETNRGSYFCTNTQLSTSSRYFYVGRKPLVPQIIGCEALYDIDNVTCYFSPSVKEMKKHSIIKLDMEFEIESYSSGYLEGKFPCKLSSTHPKTCNAVQGFHSELWFRIYLKNDLGDALVNKSFRLLNIFRYRRPTVTLYLRSPSQMSVNWTLEGYSGSLNPNYMKLESRLICSNTTMKKIYTVVTRYSPLTFNLDFQLRPYTNVTCGVKLANLNHDQFSDIGFGHCQTPPAKPSGPPILGPFENRKDGTILYINPPHKLDRNGEMKGFQLNCGYQSLLSDNYLNFDSLSLPCSISASNSVGNSAAVSIPDKPNSKFPCKLELFSSLARYYCYPDIGKYAVMLLRREIGNSNSYLEITPFGPSQVIQLNEFSVKTGQFNLGFMENNESYLLENTLESKSWTTCAYQLSSNTLSETTAEFSDIFSVKKSCESHFLNVLCKFTLTYRYPDCKLFSTPPKSVKISAGKQSPISFEVRNSSIPYRASFSMDDSSSHNLNIILKLENGHSKYFSLKRKSDGRALWETIVPTVTVLIVILIIIFLLLRWRKEIVSKIRKNPFIQRFKHSVDRPNKRDPPNSTNGIHLASQVDGTVLPELQGKRRQKSSDCQMEEESQSFQTPDLSQNGDVKHCSTANGSSAYQTRPTPTAPYDKVTPQPNIIATQLQYVNPHA